jgi:hypothetical protein
MHGLRFQLAVLLGGVLAGSLPGSAPPVQKMKAEELVRRHLDAIGTAEARAAVQNRVVEGKTGVTFRLGHSGSLEGTGRFASEVSRVRLAMEFNHSQYPGEQFVYDGKSVQVAVLTPGNRSELASLIHEHNFLLKEGLLGGTMSTAWCLLDQAARRARIEYQGLKQVDGRQLHEVSYKARQGQDLFKVRLYFEPENFLHVLTLYELRISPSIGSSAQESLRLKDNLWELREEYSSFRTADGLTLPHHYKLVLSYEGQQATLLTEWSMIATQVRHNVALEPAEFTVRK